MGSKDCYLTPNGPKNSNSLFLEDVPQILSTLPAFVSPRYVKTKRTLSSGKRQWIIDAGCEERGLRHQPHSLSRKTVWTSEWLLPRGCMSFLTIPATFLRLIGREAQCIPVWTARKNIPESITMLDFPRRVLGTSDSPIQAKPDLWPFLLLREVPLCLSKNSPSFLVPRHYQTKNLLI